MSSMRNAVQRRNHKERAQPLERQKWGILEKHKDYALRARDFNAKKARLRALREKAASRNPDEFSFAMMSSRTKGGIRYADRGNRTLDLDVVKLLKTQDTGYIRTVLQSVRRDRERLEQGLVLGDEGEVEALKGGSTRRGKHMVFVEGKEEQRAFDAGEWFGVEDEEGLERTWNRPRKEEKKGEDEDMSEVRITKQKGKAKATDIDEKEEEDLAEQRGRNQAKRRRELESLKAKEEALMTALEELDTQRAKMNNQLGGVNKKGVKFKVRARKR